MKPRLLSELVELMQPAAVEVVGDDCIVGPDVVTDHRCVKPGAVFVAIPGARVDGHSFAVQAQEAGAGAVIGMAVTEATVPHLLGEDSVRTLSWLARGVIRAERARGLISIGITGSSGKTSTKDLVAQVLERAGKTVAPVGSMNNEIGVPVTACKVTGDTSFLVSEMGARGVGHIRWLTSLVPLDIAVVLNVGRAHLGEFGEIEQTAIAKSELVQDLGENAWAVLNADDAHVRTMANLTQAHVAWVGIGEVPDGELTVQARDITVDAVSRAQFTLVVRDLAGEHLARVKLGVVGRHQVSNALSAAACGILAGMSIEDVAAGLSQAVARSSWRMALSQLPSGATLVNDAYNANPDSMEAGLRTVAEMVAAARKEHPRAKGIAILGDMLELGATTHNEHVAVGRLAADLGFHSVIAVGKFGQAVIDGAGENVPHTEVASVENAGTSLRLAPGDVVLVKGSRSVGLERVAARLEEEA